MDSDGVEIPGVDDDEDLDAKDAIEIPGVDDEEPEPEVEIYDLDGQPTLDPPPVQEIPGAPVPDVPVKTWGAKAEQAYTEAHGTRE